VVAIPGDNGHAGSTFSASTLFGIWNGRNLFRLAVPLFLCSTASLKPILVAQCRALRCSGGRIVLRPKEGSYFGQA
jgi:hypothetical protein